MSFEAQQRETRRGVFGLRRKIQGEEEIAEAELDDAFAKLEAAMLENVVTTARLRRRQSSGAMRLVSIPVPPEPPTK